MSAESSRPFNPEDLKKDLDALREIVRQMPEAKVVKLVNELADLTQNYLRATDLLRDLSLAGKLSKLQQSQAEDLFNAAKAYDRRSKPE